MIKIHSPNDEVEMSMIRGLLDSEGIRYFIHNYHFGSMKIGPQIDLYNRRTVMVAPEDADRAREVIAGFQESELTEPDEAASQYSRLRKDLRYLRPARNRRQSCRQAGRIRLEPYRA